MFILKKSEKRNSNKYLYPNVYLLFSQSVMSNSLWAHELQYSRLPYPSPSPGVCWNSHPLSQPIHLTISSCRPLLLLPSVFPNVRVFSSEWALCIVGWLNSVTVIRCSLADVLWSEVECDIPREKMTCSSWGEGMSKNGMTTFARKLGVVTKASCKTHFSSFLAPFQEHPCAVKVTSTKKLALMLLLAPGHLGLGPLNTIPVSYPV